ncbi:MAG: hypothetical protein RL136_1190, partial [Planctomycetota bacterium]
MHRFQMAVLFVAFGMSTALAHRAESQVLSLSANTVTATDAAPLAREFTVSVDLAGFAGAVGAQATIGYDPALLEFVELVGGDEFPTLIYVSHDDVAATVIFASGIDPGGSADGFTDANIARATFRTVAGACADTSAVFFTTSILPTRVSAANGTSLAFTTSTAVDITSLAPFALDGLPPARSIAADAGTTEGAFSPLVAPTATDSCGNALPVSTSRSDGQPLEARYPIGTTTVTFSATDAAGHVASGSVSVTVADHQLLDASVTLVGAGHAGSTRSMRFSAGSGVQVVQVPIIAGAGAATGIQVPVAAGYACIAAKDAGHSLTHSTAASVEGVRYTASFTLDQGDSNDDDLVDILDYSIFVSDFGLASPGGSSNFDDDFVVNSADFSFIAINYLGTGDSCGAFTGAAPRQSISVRELRRLG